MKRMAFSLAAAMALAGLLSLGGAKEAEAQSVGFGFSFGTPGYYGHYWDRYPRYGYRHWDPGPRYYYRHYRPPVRYHAPRRHYRAGPADWHAYCASKYRSYNPRTGLYLTYAGVWRPCR